MNTLATIVRSALAGIALASAVPASGAIDVTFNFDSLAPGSAANLASRQGVTFQPGAYLPTFDGNGNAIPGSDAWRMDGSADPVTVDNPAAFGRGVAPSPLNALNALFQPVLVQFAAPETIRGFGLTLDNDSFGDSAATIGFFDAGNRLLAELSLDQTRAGWVVDAALDLTGVTQVVLPAGALYDDVSISSVPEPGPLGLLVLGGFGLFAFGRRRSK